MSDDVDKSTARYKLQIVINCDLVCPPDGLDEVVSFELQKLASEGYVCVSHHVNRIKERPQKKKLGVFSIDEVLSHITAHDSKRDYLAGGKTYSVRMNSQRYFVFRDSLSCVACGLLGGVMMLEQHPGDKSAHFNLYADDNGDSVLMTKDHITARSVGGEDCHSNFQTMCSVCNNLKASHGIGLEDLRTLRHIHNQNLRLVSKKQLSKMMEEAKTQMALGQKQSALWNAPYVTLYDLNLFAYSNGELEAVSVYAAHPNEHLGCMAKGVPISGTPHAEWLLAELADGTKIRMPLKFVKRWDNDHVREPASSRRGFEAHDFVPPECCPHI